MNNPIIILSLVALLAYLAFAMMGLYEMYTPQIFTNNATARGGSLSGAFLFGAVSGTVASPCLSPGLILVLSIVTALGNKLLGFSYALYLWYWLKHSSIAYWNIFQLTQFITSSWYVDGRNKKNVRPIIACYVFLLLALHYAYINCFMACGSNNYYFSPILFTCCATFSNKLL